MARGSEDYKVEVLSSLSDLSLDKLEEIRYQIELPQISISGATADYLDTTNNKAYKEDWPESPPTTAPRETGTEFSTAEYTSITTIDNAGVSRNWTTAGYNAFIFRIKKPAAAVAAGAMAITIRCMMYDAPCDPTLTVYIYNSNASSWEAFDESVTKADGWKTLTKEIAVGTNYVNGSDYIYILMLGPKRPEFTFCGPGRISVDYLGIEFSERYSQQVEIYNSVIDTDDANIAHAQTTLVVINLNYVHDGAKWVRMTQP